jgi:hypothetical protein
MTVAATNGRNILFRIPTAFSFTFEATSRCFSFKHTRFLALTERWKFTILLTPNPGTKAGASGYEAYCTARADPVRPAVPRPKELDKVFQVDQALYISKNNGRNRVESA